MKQIIETILSVIFLFIGTVLIVSLISVEADYEKAKNYKADVISEIENSNFSPTVINTCIDEAQKHNYDLEIEVTEINPNSNEKYAEVTLSYDYSIPALNVTKNKTLRGFAR